MAGFFSKLFGGGKSGGASDDKSGDVAADGVEYKGHLIRPTPTRVGSQFETVGIIEKEIDGTLKRYRFVRVDKHSSREDAVSLIVMKGQQIIDEQGDRIYREQG